MRPSWGYYTVSGFRSHLGLCFAKKSTEHRIGFLRNVSLFQSLSETTLLSLAGELMCKTYASGERIITQGESGKEFYILCSGYVDFFKIESVKADDSLGTKVGDIDTPGQYFGELALLNDETRQATAVARGNVECFVLERKKFTQLLGPVRARLLQQTALNGSYAQKKKPFSPLIYMGLLR